MRAQNVGIHAVEVYFPKTYIKQEELETYNQVGKGKYTAGLLQTEMAFVKEFEDINSITMTVVQNLMEKYNIDPKQIGSLQIGTETLIDKAKSIKTNLMQLFKTHGNHDIEGVTNINACYGGTAALFNSFAWLESSAWDGRLGIVVMTDIAVYKKGPARPTGGAGCIALLVGPNAPITIEPLRATFMDHTYDFYKPDPRSEFPTVDGKISIGCYVNAIDQCYTTLKQKQKKLGQKEVTIKDFDFGCFHAPFGKMVQKAFFKLVYRDMLSGDIQVDQKVMEDLKNQPYDSKIVQQHISSVYKPLWEQKVKPTLSLGSRIGNIYTGSLYAGLASLISNVQQLQNKRIFMFSYGSGLCSSMFFLRVNQNLGHIAQQIQMYPRLDARIKYEIEPFEQLMAIRESKYGHGDFQTQVNLEELEEGAYYLVSCDKQFRRSYARKPVNPNRRVQKLEIQTSQNHIFSEIQTQQQLSQKRPEVLIEEQQQQLSGASRLSLINSDVKNSQQSRSKSPDHSKIWNGFYKKTMKERLDLIQKVDSDLETSEYLTGGLELMKADVMVENCVGKIAIPMGLGLNFNINGKQLQVPMAIEEPSVVAAASSAGKFVSEFGSGFKTSSSDPIMIGQIQLLDVESSLQLQKLENQKQQIIAKANEFCQNMVKRGGGVKDLRVRLLDSSTQNVKSTGLYEVSMMGVVDLFVDVCDSMGANIINTICEGIAPYLQQLSGARVGIKILSNLCVNRKAVSEFIIPVKNMAWKSASGEEVAKKIIESYRFAQLDPFRASTHNKGVMNGIDAVAIALGQDWRSIEASCHAFASTANSTYQPLTHYEIIKIDDEICFKGSLEVPISVGTRGGVIDNNKIYESNLRLLGYPNAQTLSEIMVCVGLAQNFAALRALAVEGIQRGHMSLHAKNIAISAGVPAHLAEDAARFMKKRGKITSDVAKDYIRAYDLFGSVRKNNQNLSNRKEVLSTFFVELQIPKMDESVTLHVALDCSTIPVHISMEKEQSLIENTDLHNKIFGVKGYLWLQKMFTSLEMVRIHQNQSQQQKTIVPKMKLISILIDLIISNMLNYAPQQTKILLEKIHNNSTEEARSLIHNTSDMTIKYGLSLLQELIHIFHYNIEQNTSNLFLRNELISELYKICASQVQAEQLWKQVQNQIKQQQQTPVYFEQYEQFFEFRKKRLCATMMLLCDCLNLNENEINAEQIDTLKQLGNIYEIEMTFAHDLTRWDPMNVLRDMNTYTFYLKYQQKLNTAEATSQQQIDQFVQNCQEMIRQQKNKLDMNPKFNDELRKLAQTTSKVIKDYYNISTYKFNHFNAINNTQIKPRL